VTAPLLSLQLWTFKNRIVARVRRLRQARYLAGTIVGLSYVFFVWRPWRFVRIGGPPPEMAAKAGTLAPYLEVGLAALMTALALLRWLWPGSKPVLDFSEAEVAFLFPAPLTRARLVRYSIARSQFGIVFGVFMLSFFGLRMVAPHFAAAFIACWIAMATLQLHFLASTVIRSNVLSHGLAGVRRSWPVAVAALALTVMVAAWAVGWLRPPGPDDQGRMGEYVLRMLTSGPMAWLLYPGRLLVRPAFAPDLLAFLKAIGPAILLLLANYLWVIRSDFAFEEASADRAAKRGEQRAERAATGRRHPFSVRAGARRAPFRLAASGRPEIAILWKNLIATSRLLSVRYLLILIAPLTAVAVMLSQGGRSAWVEFMPVSGTLCLVLAAVLLVAGPGLVRSDLRMDLRMVDLLKSYPLEGHTLMLGEILAPVTVITVLQAVLLAFAVPLMAGVGGLGALDWAAMAIGGLFLAGPLNLVTSLVQNAALLAFPAWHRLGTGRVRGIEALGQAMIASVLRLLVLALTFLPTGAILALGLFLTYSSYGVRAVPVIAFLGAMPAVAEGWLGLRLLGIFFDRFDPSKELDVAT